MNVGAPNSSAFATVKNNIIRNNLNVGGAVHGGGLLISSSGLVQGNVLEHNTFNSSYGGTTSGVGGGLLVLNSGNTNVTVTDNSILENTGHSGAGLHVDDGAQALVVNNVIARNLSSQGSAGVKVDGGGGLPSIVTLVNNTIVDNNPGTDGPGYGGQGIEVSGSQVTLVNDLFWGNGPGNNDFYVHDSEGIPASLTVQNTAFSDLAVTNPGADPGKAPILGTGNKVGGVQFASPLFVNAAAGNYHLQGASVLLDAGTSSFGVPNVVPAKDRDGAERPQGAGVDMGAYEGAGVAQPQPGQVRFALATQTVGEGAGSLAVVVQRLNGSDGTITVTYATANGTAAAGSDYHPVTGIITFAAGETSKTITLGIVDDNLVEGDENFSITLSAPTGGATLGAPTTETITISDNDQLPPGEFQLAASSVSVAENAGSLSVVVQRVNGSGGTVTVQYATANGTAAFGTDYSTGNGILTFTAGETSKTITIPILDDVLVEGNEHFSFSLTSPTGGATLGTPSTMTITILDNDALPANQVDFYVRSSAPAGGNGSLAAPFQTISQAYSAATASKDYVFRIATGMYGENVGNSTDLYGVNRTFTFLGGYDAAFTNRVGTSIVTAANAALPVFTFYNAKAVTIDGFDISGGRSGIQITGWSSGRSATLTNNKIHHNGTWNYHSSYSGVMYGGGVRTTATTTLIENNTVEWNIGHEFGGGLNVGASGSGSQATIRNNTIRDNLTVGGTVNGGGLLLSTSGLVEGNTVLRNSFNSAWGGIKSGYGGGVLVMNTGSVAVTVKANRIEANRGASGVGLAIDGGAKATVVNNVIVGNQSSQGSAGVRVNGASGQTGPVTLINNTITNNNAGIDGPGNGGQGLEVAGAQVTAINDLFWGNGLGNNDFYLYASSGLNPSLTVASSAFTDPAATNPGSDKGIAPTLGSGNLLGGVHFSNPGFVNAAMGDYHLLATSAMLKKGTLSYGSPNLVPTKDFDGKTRSTVGGVDIGAYEL